MKKLFLLRGLPGSGKSTLAKSLGGVHYEADMFFIKDGEYKFNANHLKMAHEWCQTMVWDNMKYGTDVIVVSNTFTREWEMKPYYEMAKRFGYMVFSLIVENRHNGKDEHGVPDDKLKQMKTRFEVKL